MPKLLSTSSDTKSQYVYIELPVDIDVKTVQAPIKVYQSQITAVPSGYTTVRPQLMKRIGYGVWIQRRITNINPQPITRVRHIKELSTNEYSLVLNDGISLEVEFEESNGMNTVYSEAFGIYGSGETEDIAYQDFCQTFIEFYCNIVDSPDKELGASTKKFKKTLKSFARLIKRV